MPAIIPDSDAQRMLISYEWPGNIRQLKNIAEQISVIETNRSVNGETLRKYLPGFSSVKVPALYNSPEDAKSFASEREILYKILFDMKNDMNDLKKLVLGLASKRVQLVTMFRKIMRILLKSFMVRFRRWLQMRSLRPKPLR